MFSGTDNTLAVLRAATAEIERLRAENVHLRETVESLTVDKQIASLDHLRAIRRVREMERGR